MARGSKYLRTGRALLRTLQKPSSQEVPRPSEQQPSSGSSGDLRVCERLPSPNTPLFFGYDVTPLTTNGVPWNAGVSSVMFPQNHGTCQFAALRLLLFASSNTLGARGKLGHRLARERLERRFLAFHGVVIQPPNTKATRSPENRWLWAQIHEPQWHLGRWNQRLTPA